MTESARRYLRTRERPWAGSVARTLARLGARPNGISILSIVFAAISAAAFWIAGSGFNRPLFFFIAAAGIQLRLLCNMLDGLLAVEGGFKTKLGDIYNELPDRIADVLILVGAGYSVRFVSLTIGGDALGLTIHGTLLGWAAAVLALMTAYVRLLAGSLGAPQRFLGPMAKQHRMFVITVGALASMVEYIVHQTTFSMYVVLVIVVAGTFVTVIRRVAALARDLKQR